MQPEPDHQPPQGLKLLTRPEEVGRSTAGYTRIVRQIAPSSRDQARRVALGLADLLAVIATAVALVTLTGHTSAGVVVLAMAPVWIVVAKAQDLYDADEAKAWHATSDEAARLFYWALISVALTWLALSFAGVGDLDAFGAVMAYAVALITAATGRATARMLWRRVIPSERAVVLGGGELADRVIRKFRLERGHHLEVAARIDVEALPPADQIARVQEAIDATAAHRVIVADEHLPADSLGPIVAACRINRVKLSVVPRTDGVLGSTSRVHQVAEIAFVELAIQGMSPAQHALKRTLDVVVASLALVVTAPVALLAALAVRLDSPGPVIFRQQRAGQGGRPFTMLKFRSMHRDAEQQLATLIDLDALGAAPVFKLEADPRVTRVGRFLRASSLDELPQLLNVLRGDMSLVGPRPEETRVVELYDETAKAIRLAVKPGVTGPMQVHGRGELTFEERLAIDRHYVESYSLGQDLKILVKTVSVVLARHGAS